MAYTPLTFYSQCGKNVRVTERGLKVETKTGGCGDGGALTARPLRTEEVFTVQLNGRPWLCFGVTTHSPKELVEFPAFMYELHGTRCLMCGSEGLIYMKGRVVNNKFLSTATLDALKEGDTLGLQVMKDRKLHFYVNGKDVGIAATNIPDTVYGLVDLFYGISPPVKLIPDVRETSQKMGAPTRALPQATPMHMKEIAEKIEEKKYSPIEKADISPSTSVQAKMKEISKSTVREIVYSELEFGEILGEGGQGAVYEGQWKSISFWKTGSHSVAIKRVLGKIRDQEAGILSKLSHPNVITFYGICTERYPEYFIITELAEGGSLYNLIHEKHYHPDPEESMRWAEEIAEGMRYLHQHKVIHRDLKSHNVLLAASGTIKLCDFGSAKEFDHTTIQTGTGTYRWIAPEVLKGVKVSLSCDVFSYGMVLFEIFKQEVPFAGIHDIKVANMILEGKTPVIPASLKPYLAKLMKCCWQMNPKARPSFEEVLVILEKKECPEPVGGSLQATQDIADRRSADVPLTSQDLPHLQTVLDIASGMWYPLGMKLKLDTRTLTGIATASGNDTSTALSLMLTRWLKSKDQPPLIQSLTAALSSPDIGLTHLSDTLLDQYGQ